MNLSQTFAGKIAKQKILVSISNDGVTVKGTKDGKAKAHFGPSALDQVKCKVGQGKQKNELTVTTSRALRFAEPPTFFCVVELCLKRLVLIFLVCTQPRS
jgi:hypothetical protein|eukprot:COSAG02_NODE_2693_length_8220_cov_3.340106_4_plen_100_part_00